MVRRHSCNGCAALVCLSIGQLGAFAFGLRLANGLNGLNGPNGFNGLDGLDGFDGLDGIDGLNGLNGLNGFNGHNGFKGFTGVNGVTGFEMLLTGKNTGSGSTGPTESTMQMLSTKLTS